MLLLLNAQTISIVNGQEDDVDTAPQTGTVASFIRWMNSFSQHLEFPTDSVATMSVVLILLIYGFIRFYRSLSDLQFYKDHQLSMSFIEAAKEVLQLDNVSIESANRLALQFHVNSAAVEGKLDILKHFFLRGLAPSYDALKAASEKGHLDIVNYVIKEHVRVQPELKKEIYEKIIKYDLLDHIEVSLISDIKSGLSEYDLADLDEKYRCQICMMDKKIECGFSCRGKDGCHKHGTCQECYDQIKENTKACPYCRASIEEEEPVESRLL